MIPVICIDGPSSSGKGTLSKYLANILKWNILNSGMIYRMLAFFAILNKINIKNEYNVIQLASKFNLEFSSNNVKLTYLLNDRKINNYFLNENIGNIASKIATYSKVREIIINLQRSFKILPGLIADGRDMGTIIFPNANVKIFLYASSDIRALRRLRQLQKNGINVNLNTIKSDIEKRDFRDKNRLFSPLIPADDCIYIDSSKFSVRTIADFIIKNYLKYLV